MSKEQTFNFKKNSIKEEAKPTFINKYYLENREKIIERQKEWNKLHRKKKGRLASKRDRVKLALKKNEKRVEAFRQFLLDGEGDF